MRMKVFERIDDLHGVALHFKFMKPLSSFQQFIHALILAQFQQNVNIFSIFEEMLELAYINMLDASVDFDFAHQLLFSPTFGKTRLLNYLCSVHIICVRIDKLPTFCKSSFS